MESDQTKPFVEAKTTSTTGSKSAISQTSSSSTRPRLFWLCVASVLAGIAYRINLSGPEYKTVTQLPDSYALCSNNGTIYTVNEVEPVVDCMLVRKDKIIATGTSLQVQWEEYQNALIARFYGNEPSAKKPLTIIRPVPGSIVVPGLADAHAHLIMYGFKVELPLDGAETFNDVLDIIEDYVRSHPDVFADETRWVEGMGWDQTRWKGWRGGFPTAADLAIRPLLASRPLALHRVDGHALWVSPTALAFVNPGPGEIEGGEVVRYENGEMTGVFLDAAMALVPKPPRSAAQMKAYLERALTDALAVGLTSVHDADVEVDMIDVFKQVADEGKLPLRVYAMGHSNEPTYWGDKIPWLTGYGRDGRLNVRSVKLYTDGALGSWGAALLEPYSDNPGTSGLMRSDEAALNATVARFWEAGWGINIHCIGDRANKAVLDIFEGLLGNDTEQAHARRPRIEHAQIMRVGDIERAGRLGVITSVQPTHATSDMGYAESRLGRDRIKGGYAYQSLLQASPLKTLPLGSDFPVEGINPLLGFYAAVSRLDVNGNSPHGPGGWYPAERLTRAQALKGMTLDAAYAAFAEHELGSLEPEKKADFVVLDTDIMREDAPFTEILATKVRATVVDGQILYGAI
ncbi:amidohydrolase family-domain-containing protein [Sparassis latifolia]